LRWLLPVSVVVGSCCGFLGRGLLKVDPPFVFVAFVPPL
jgi:hypothetical protein